MSVEIHTVRKSFLFYSKFFLLWINRIIHAASSPFRKNNVSGRILDLRGTSFKSKYKCFLMFLQNFKIRKEILYDE